MGLARNAMVRHGESPCTLMSAPMYHAAGVVTGANSTAHNGSVCTVTDFVPSEGVPV